MAAITPRLGREQLMSPVERQYFKCVGEAEQGLRGTLGIAMECPSPGEVLSQSHTGLLQMIYVRAEIERAFVGRSFTVMSGRPRPDGGVTDPHTVYLVLDGPIGTGPVWNPIASPAAQAYGLLSWTSKMNAPSFSLPAGAYESGGTCPGAIAGQSIVPVDKIVRHKKFVDRVLERQPRSMEMDLTTAVCEHCVTGDARVLVQDRGLVRVEDLLSEKTFTVWSGKGWRETHVIAQGVKPVVEIRTSWGQMIRVTADHKVLTLRGMIEAQDLQLDDMLVFEPANRAPQAEHVPIRRRPDAVAHGSARHINAAVEKFPQAWDYDTGLFLGYVLGDGTVSYSKPRYPAVLLSSAQEDAPDIEQIIDKVAVWCPDARADSVVRTPAPNKFCAAPQPQVYVHWHLKGLVEFLEDLGLDKKLSPESRRAPEQIWTASREGVRGFLSGMFSTDGSVTTNASGKIEVSLASVSEGLLRDVQQLLFAFAGIRSTICPYTTSNERRVEQGYRPLWKLGINAIEHVRLFAEHVGFFNARKSKRLAEALLACVDMQGRNRWPQVESVTALPKHEPVYDLVNVGEERQFVANGITISNCYAEGGQYSTGSVQAAQVLRHIWTKQAIATPVRSSEGFDSTMFIETMVAAISGADFKLHGGTVKVEEWELDGVRSQEHTVALPPEPSGRKFFRIHDSGDFFSPEYLAQWKAVANRLPHITFWAPSRVWAVSDAWINHVNRINTPMPDGRPSNLVIRPSAYYVNEHGPNFRKLGPGWAAASTVIAKKVNTGMTPDREQFVVRLEGKSEHRAPGGPDPRFDWDCVAAGTLIHVKAQGLIPIEQIGKLLDRGLVEVLTRQGWQPINAFRSVGTRETVLVRTKAGYNVRVTPDHEIAREDGGWMAARLLAPGDVVKIAPEDAGAAHDDGVSLSPWDETRSYKGPAAQLPDATFPKTWTYNLGLVLGYFVGDAHFREKAVAVEVGHTKKEDLLALNRIVCSWTGHDAHFAERVHQGTELVPQERLAHIAIWGDQRLMNFLQPFGYAHGVNSHLRRAPRGIFQAPREALLGFLSGLISADGSLLLRPDGDGQVNVWTTSRGLAHDVQMIFALLGGRTSISSRPRQPYRELHQVTVHSKSGLQIVKDAKLLSAHKRAMVDAIVLPPKQRHRDTRVVEVVNDMLPVEVFDLSVPGVEEFTANGLIVHNCRAYATDDQKHTCRKAVAPPGMGGPDGKGCRACWLQTDEVINYTLH